jgi:hypothetical protein
LDLRASSSEASEPTLGTWKLELLARRLFSALNSYCGFRKAFNTCLKLLALEKLIPEKAAGARGSSPRLTLERMHES